MEFELFKKISPFPFIRQEELHDSNKLDQHRTCLKCKKQECTNFKNYAEDNFICYKGFNCILHQLKNEKIIFNGLILEDNRSVKSGIRDARKEYIFSRHHIQEAIDDLKNISECIDEGIKSNIRERFSLFHDVRSSYAIAFSHVESLILKNEGASIYEKLQNSDQHIIDLYDSLDLVNSQLELIDIMVNPSAIVQGTKRNINLFKLVDKLRKLYALKAQKRELTIFARSSETIPYGRYHDSIKLIPIILLENAIKYSDEANQIHVTFSIEHDNRISFEVSSYGLLVPEDERQIIFNKQIRGSNTKRYTEEGIGMGLFIARNILTKHGGSITYSSEIKGYGGYGFNKFKVIV